MDFNLEILLAVIGGIVSLIGVIFGFGFKFAKYDGVIQKNSEDIDNVAAKLRSNGEKLDTLTRDVMALSTETLDRLAEEIKPIRESIMLLTEKTIYNQTTAEHFRTEVNDIKSMIGEIKRDVMGRPCINHQAHANK